MLILWLLGFLTSDIGATGNNELDENWESFKKLYNRFFSDDIEENYRKLIFTENSYRISSHHKKYLNGQSSFDLTMNEYGDLLHHEFVSQMTGLSWSSKHSGIQNHSTTYLPAENVDIPRSINWVSKGYVTAVKNQGTCGSCWSFSATGALEGQHKRKTSKLVSLSEQNLIDCSQKYGNKGCKGGLPDFAFKYIMENGGVDTEESYPYEEREGKCRFEKSKIGATDTGFVDIKSESETNLMKAVGTLGPVSAGIDASQPSFQFYSKGVYDEPNCSSHKLNHAILVVGYGNQKGTDFWLVKNSWGTSWGTNGYIRMSRRKKNQCGIATSASFPLV